jgi:uncharacterized protein
MPFNKFILPALLFCGCQTSVLTRQDYMPDYQIGQIAVAESTLDAALHRSMPGNNYTKSKDAVWLLLDSATLKFANGNIQDAIKDYQLAIEAIDYYNQRSPSEWLCQLALQDDVGAYAGDEFEQILARVYFALALFQAGDQNNAYALLRQAEDIQQVKKEVYRNDRLTCNFELYENPVAKYLLAVAQERRGDYSNADILYTQTEKLIHNKLSCLGLAKEAENFATVIVVVHNGNAPYKISGTADASVASAVALELMLGSCNIPPALSSLTGIPTPVLMQQIFSNPFPVTLRLFREDRVAIPFYNVTAAASRQIYQNTPLTVARGVARFALRRAAVAAANEKDPCLGTLVDMGMLVANACTQADTRSWATLPCSIDLARYDIPAGCHTLHIQTHYGLSVTFKDECSLQLEPNDLCIINVFNIHPGIVSVQVPKKYINMEFSYDPQNNSLPIPDPADSIDVL